MKKQHILLLSLIVFVVLLLNTVFIIKNNIEKEIIREEGRLISQNSSKYQIKHQIDSSLFKTSGKVYFSSKNDNSIVFNYSIFHNPLIIFTKNLKIKVTSNVEGDLAKNHIKFNNDSIFTGEINYNLDSKNIQSNLFSEKILIETQTDKLILENLELNYTKEQKQQHVFFTIKQLKLNEKLTLDNFYIKKDFIEDFLIGQTEFFADKIEMKENNLILQKPQITSIISQENEKLIIETNFNIENFNGKNIFTSSDFKLSKINREQFLNLLSGNYKNALFNGFELQVKKLNLFNVNLGSISLNGFLKINPSKNKTLNLEADSLLVFETQAKGQLAVILKDSLPLKFEKQNNGLSATIKYSNYTLYNNKIPHNDLSLIIRSLLKEIK